MSCLYHVFCVVFISCVLCDLRVCAMFISWVLCHVHIAIGFRQMGKPNFAKNTRNAGDVTVLMQIQ